MTGFRRERTASVADVFFYEGRIPSDLIPALRALLPAPKPFVLEAFDGLSASEYKSLSRLDPSDREGLTAPSPVLTEESALHDLVATLTLIGDNKVPVGETTGQPTLTAIRAMRQRFLVPDVTSSAETDPAQESIRPFGFAMIVQAAGLARAKGSRLELTKLGRAALADPTLALLKQCWEAWIAGNGFDELARVRGIKGQKSKGQKFTPPSERKSAISRALAACPTGGWLPVSDFLRFVRLEHNFAVDVSQPTRLYLGPSSDYGWLGYKGGEFWNVVNAAYIRVILLEYAASLGLIDVATLPIDETGFDFSPDDSGDGMDPSEFSRYSGLAHLRINNLGRYILGLSDSYDGPAQLSAQAALKVLPSLDVVIADRAGLPPNDRAMLERFSTRVSDDVYRLTRERLLEAIEGGLDPRDAEAFLRRRGSQDLPQTATVFFADAIHAALAVRAVGPALLFECADPHVATLISHDTTLRSLCLLAGNRHLVVQEASLAAFRRGLRRLGYTLPERGLMVKGRKATSGSGKNSG